MRKTKPLWMDRSSLLLPYWGVCFSQEQYDAYRESLGIDEADWPPFLNPGADGTTHTFSSSDGRLAVLVCINYEGYGTVEWDALAAHETRHLIEAVFATYRGLERGEELEATILQIALIRVLQAAAEYKPPPKRKPRRKKKTVRK